LMWPAHVAAMRVITLFCIVMAAALPAPPRRNKVPLLFSQEVSRNSIVMRGGFQGLTVGDKEKVKIQVTPDRMKLLIDVYGPGGYEQEKFFSPRKIIGVPTVNHDQTSHGMVTIVVPVAPGPPNDTREMQMASESQDMHSETKTRNGESKQMTHFEEHHDQNGNMERSSSSSSSSFSSWSGGMDKREPSRFAQNMPKFHKRGSGLMGGHFMQDANNMFQDMDKDFAKMDDDFGNMPSLFGHRRNPQGPRPRLSKKVVSSTPSSQMDTAMAHPRWLPHE